MYEDFFYTMHKKTDLPISVIYAFFIIEATNAGIESKLMAKAFNPGGIKYRGTGKKINAIDDCYKNGKKIPCAFQAFSSYNAMVQGWADVLNLPRYKNCKRYVFAKYNRGMSAKNIVDATCKCFYKSGYHTSNLWKVRSNLSTEYWTVKASFPEMEY
jgi:flagellum-specific peptidoglycan hydrolase FlgJ